MLCAEAILGCIAACGQPWAAAMSYSNAWGDCWQAHQPFCPEMQRHHEAAFAPASRIELLGGTRQDLAPTCSLVSISRNFHIQNSETPAPRTCFAFTETDPHFSETALFLQSELQQMLLVHQHFITAAGPRSSCYAGC